MENEITDKLNEWNKLITKLTYMEIEFYRMKQELFEKEQEIIDTVDFKGIYGKNNADVRKKHLRTELSDEYDLAKMLELKLDETKRRLSFIKEDVRFKMMMMEIKQNKG